MTHIEQGWSRSCRVWFKLRVKTRTGYTEEAEAGEMIVQGTVGGALTNSTNLDSEIWKLFEGSSQEIHYATVGLLKEKLRKRWNLQKNEKISGMKTGI